MILSASVIRVRDGLPLSASTDYEQGTGMQECRQVEVAPGGRRDMSSTVS